MLLTLYISRVLGDELVIIISNLMPDLRLLITPTRNDFKYNCINEREERRERERERSSDNPIPLARSGGPSPLAQS